MVRQRMNVNPAQKHLHIYQDFHGGMNTVDAPEKILDNECQDLVNIELGERGSLKRRHGMISFLDAPNEEGEAQGFFRYFKEDGEFHYIVAKNGKLFKNGEYLEIEGLENGFQTERKIEAVQYKGIMYIATGTRLVQYDGDVAKVVEPYKPRPLEALYVGTNGLADNPDDFMQDGESEHLRVDGVTFNNRYGIVNEPIRLTAYISKPPGTDVEYKFEKRTEEQREGFWEVMQDWTSDNEYEFTTEYQGDLQFRVWAKPAGADDVEARQFLVPKYKVKPVPDPSDDELPTDTIHSCNRLVLHWDRLVLYGDVNEPDTIFISHLFQPDYFPIPNSLMFESEERTPIQKIVRFHDELIVFTEHSIQALFGKSPMEYKRIMLNPRVGCVAPDSVRVMQNYVAFLSNEGVQVLKSLAYNDTRANLEKIDRNIENMIRKDKNAVAEVQDSQYHLVYPDSGERFRCYIEQDYVWTKDKSEKLDFVDLREREGQLYGLRKNGQVVQFDETVYDDDGYMYEDRIETKAFDFGEPYHDKKLREIHLIMANQNKRTQISTFIYADNSLIVGTDTSYAEIDENDYVYWVYQSEPNFDIYGGTSFGDWTLGESPFGKVYSEIYHMRLSGRSKRTRIILSHTDDTPIQLLGLGYIFKVKAP